MAANVLLDSNGKRKLRGGTNNGKVQIGTAGDSCCCSNVCCDNGADYTQNALVTISGWTPCCSGVGDCRSADPGHGSVKMTANTVNGTFCLPSTGPCVWHLPHAALLTWDEYSDDACADFLVSTTINLDLTVRKVAGVWQCLYSTRDLSGGTPEPVAFVSGTAAWTCGGTLTLANTVACADYDCTESGNPLVVPEGEGGTVTISLGGC